MIPNCIAENRPEFTETHLGSENHQQNPGDNQPGLRSHQRAMKPNPGKMFKRLTRWRNLLLKKQKSMKDLETDNCLRQRRVAIAKDKITTCWKEMSFSIFTQLTKKKTWSDPEGQSFLAHTDGERCQ